MHKINGQLILCLACKKPEFRWLGGEWIVNVIAINRSEGVSDSAHRETRATLYYGRKFFEEGHCSPDAPVTQLNADVPLKGSFAGYSVFTGNIVWIDDLANHPFRRKYRMFEYVGVTPQSDLPTAEYVFRMRARVGLSESLLGVLNCEWYKHSSLENPFAGRRDEISDEIIQVLDAHGHFMALAMDARIALLPNCSEEQGMLDFHRCMLEATDETTIKAEGDW